MENMIAVGIDLGKDGALVAVNDREQIVTQSKTPIVTAAGKGKKKGRDEYNVPEMLTILQVLKARAAMGGAQILAIVEKAQPMPAKLGGAITNFQRGLSYGLWTGLLAGVGIPYEIVRPIEWQSTMFRGVNVDDTKQASVLVAQRLFPGVDFRRSAAAHKPDDGLTDAVLMGVFGLRCRLRAGAAHVAP